MVGAGLDMHGEGAGSVMPMMAGANYYNRLTTSNHLIPSLPLAPLITVGMVTMTNSVVSELRNRSRASAMRA